MSAPPMVEVPPTVQVDPRFRERRTAVRKQAGRHRLRRLGALVLVAAVALLATVVLRSPILDVDDVLVVGVQQVDAELVRDAAGIGVGSPLLLADLAGATRAVEALPWVAEARVSRELPGRVRIRVTERRPAAVVAGPGGDAVLVDVTGRVLGPAPPPSYPPLVTVSLGTPPPAAGSDLVGPGPAGTDAGAFGDHDPDLVLGLAQQLHTNPAGLVASIHLEPDLWLGLVDGGVVRLGGTGALDLKLEALRTLHARVDWSCLHSIDLRVPTHPVLTRHQGCP